MRRRAVRAERAARDRQLLPLHALPAPPGTAASANASVVPGSFRLISGGEHLGTWSPEGGFHKIFCTSCGAALYSQSPTDPEIIGVRLGAFDRDPGVRPPYRQFVAYAAPWEPIPDDGLPRHPERAPALDYGPSSARLSRSRSVARSSALSAPSTSPSIVCCACSACSSAAGRVRQLDDVTAAVARVALARRESQPRARSAAGRSCSRRGASPR